MNRTVSSERPLGAFSDSISVTNPYLYWSTSIRRTCSTVSCTAGILPSAHGCKDRGLDLSVMVGSLIALRSFLVAPPQAAFACSLSSDETTLFQAVHRVKVKDPPPSPPAHATPAPCRRSMRNRKKPLSH